TETGIERGHLEEDAAKTIHAGGATGRSVGADYSLVDFNRGGTPLLEIVTEPDIHSAEDADRFLRLLRLTIQELGISDAEMEKGTMRADVNVSVRAKGETAFRPRWELKNMNSFTFIRRGIERIAAEIGIDAAWELVTTSNDRRAQLLADEGVDWKTAAAVAMNRGEFMPKNAAALAKILQANVTREALDDAFAKAATEEIAA